MFRAMPLIDVALALPLFRTFTYRVPDGVTGSVTPGSRVVVPFRNRTEIGIVIGEATPRDGMKLKDAVAAPDNAPVMDERMLAQVVLGAMMSNGVFGDRANNYDLLQTMAGVHQAIGWVTWGALSGAAAVMLF